MFSLKFTVRSDQPVRPLAHRNPVWFCLIALLGVMTNPRADSNMNADALLPEQAGAAKRPVCVYNDQVSLGLSGHLYLRADEDALRQLKHEIHQTGDVSNGVPLCSQAEAKLISSPVKLDPEPKKLSQLTPFH